MCTPSGMLVDIGQNLVVRNIFSTYLEGSKEEVSPATHNHVWISVDTIQTPLQLDVRPVHDSLKALMHLTFQNLATLTPGEPTYILNGL